MGGSAAKHQMLTSQDKLCVCVCVLSVRWGAMGTQFEILCFMFDPFYVFSKLCSSTNPFYIHLSTYPPDHLASFLFLSHLFLFLLFYFASRVFKEILRLKHGCFQACWNVKKWVFLWEKSQGFISNYACVKKVLFFLSHPLITSIATAAQPPRWGNPFQHWKESVFTRSSMCCVPTLSWMSITALFAWASGSAFHWLTWQHGVGHKSDALQKFCSPLVWIGKRTVAVEVFMMRCFSPGAHTQTITYRLQLTDV